MNREPQTRKYQLGPALLETAERIAASRPGEMVTVWGADMRCYFAAFAPDAVPGGYSADEILGHQATEFIHVSELQQVALTQSDAELTGESIEYTVNFLNRQGERIRLRNRKVMLTDPVDGKTFSLVRSVLYAQRLSKLE